MLFARTLVNTLFNLARLKCNIDAFFSESLNMVGIGMCIRDENDIFILAKQEYFSPICEVHIGEALGLLYALDWVHELNLGPVDFELDAKRVVDSFNSQNCDATEFGNIISHCKSRCTIFYENSCSSLCGYKQTRLLIV